MKVENLKKWERICMCYKQAGLQWKESTMDGSFGSRSVTIITVDLICC